MTKLPYKPEWKDMTADQKADMLKINFQDLEARLRDLEPISKNPGNIQDLTSRT